MQSPATIYPPGLVCDYIVCAKFEVKSNRLSFYYLEQHFLSSVAENSRQSVRGRHAWCTLKTIDFDLQISIHRLIDAPKLNYAYTHTSVSICSYRYVTTTKPVSLFCVPWHFSAAERSHINLERSVSCSLHTLAPNDSFIITYYCNPNPELKLCKCSMFAAQNIFMFCLMVAQAAI